MEVNSDEDLMEQICQQRHEAFTVLVRRHTDKYYSLAYRVLGDRGDAEDVVQEAFLRIWRKSGMWNRRKMTKFTTWFYRITLNLALDYKKKRKPILVDNLLEIPTENPDRIEILKNLEQQRQLEKAIRLLPERQQTALNLCFYEELSNKEAAMIMGISLKALQSLLMRGKSALKKELKLEGAL
ncbi:MAG: sigma-70 family RNA polymerase sigma factor [Verrucomicrobiota bacterium]